MGSHDGRTPRQVFGGMVRFYREKAGLSRTELATRICKSVALVQAIELGDRTATEEVTGDLETALGTNGALMRLREQMGDGLSYQAVYPAWFQEWTWREREATRLRMSEPVVVPGLLQTEAYARAIFSTRFGITEEEVAEQVAARMKRQEILAGEDPVALWAILDVWALRRPIGGPDVMLDQVNRLIEAANKPNMLIQVIPADTGAHEGVRGGFIIADFAAAPSAGYQEGAMWGQPVEEPKDVTALSLIWDTVRGDALSRAASQGLLEEAAKSWTQAL
jgi:transcriptional regulator with XRE-family HTH domain